MTLSIIIPTYNSAIVLQRALDSIVDQTFTDWEVLVMDGASTDDTFYTLYHHAMAFIYPSAYEGFGLPILEAFTCGCPVLLNKASCFPDVGGDAAIYFDINRRGDLAEHIEAFLQVPEQDRKDLIARGRERAQLFSWEESAKKLSHIYKNLLA